MIEWFASHNGIEQLFLLSGIVGGIILLFRLILMVAGIDHHGGRRSPRQRCGFPGAHHPGHFLVLRHVWCRGLHAVSRRIARQCCWRSLGALGAGVFSMWLIHKNLSQHVAPAIERHGKPVRRGGQRRLGVPHRRQGRRPGADQLRQPAARVRGGVRRRLSPAHRHADPCAERDGQYAGGRAGPIADGIVS